MGTFTDKARVIFISEKMSKFIENMSFFSIGLSYCCSVYLLFASVGTPAFIFAIGLFWFNTGTVTMRVLRGAFYNLTVWKMYLCPWLSVSEWKKAKTHHAELVKEARNSPSFLGRVDAVDFETWSVLSLESFVSYQRKFEQNATSEPQY